MREPVVGLDVETTLDLGVLCVIQLATPTETFVTDALAIDDLTLMVELLRAPAVLKVIHHARFEQQVFGGIITPVFDTLEASRRRHGVDALGGHSLAMVAERELGLRLDKREQTSNWSVRPLSQEQLEYAALDAEILLALYERLSSTG